MVSRIAFGCEPMGGNDWGVVNDRESFAAVKRALDLGVNFFDTADVYGLGHSEEILSEALGSRRKDVVIATKCGVNWEESPGHRARTFCDSSPAHVVSALEASLRRLKIDCIPLYQIHWPDPRTPIAETIEALDRCRNAGKIRYFGVSNYSAKQVRQAHLIRPLASVQMEYNLIDRHAEDDLMPCCRELSIGSITYGALAQGLLTGKYDQGSVFGCNDRRSRLAHFNRDVIGSNLRVVERLREVGRQYGKTPTQVSIRWVLENPLVKSVIVGIKTTYQLEENLDALGWTMAPEERDSLPSVH
jgi:myo-inositol catabolism protein IolS